MRKQIPLLLTGIVFSLLISLLYNFIIKQNSWNYVWIVFGLLTFITILLTISNYFYENWNVNKWNT